MGIGRSKTMHRLHLAIAILVGFAGAGVARASPKISLDPNPLDFFGPVVGYSNDVAYTVTNTGKVQLVVMDMQITGPDADQFHFEAAIDPFCGDGRDCTPNFKLSPGASRSFYVACAPSHPGFFRSTLTVKSNAATSTIALICTGDAPASMSTLTFSPASIDFGVSFAEPASPNPHLDRTLTVTNTATAPSEPVEFQVVVPGVPGNGSFSLPLGQFGFLGPGESQDFVIEFRWSGGVVSTRPVVLQSSDPGQPSISVPMFAEAAYGQLVFDDPPDLFSFISMPPVAAGDTSTLTIKAHNGGDFELEMDASGFVGFGGTGELQGQTGFVSLAPGETIQWTLTCTPDGSEGAEDGATGIVEFDYFTAASENDLFFLFCPIEGAPLTARASPSQLGHASRRTLVLDNTEAPALTPVDTGASSASDAGGCSAATPTSLAPLGLLALGLLLPGRRTWRRRWHVVSGARSSDG